MASKTLSFLPTIFQTDANEKFLSATLDQLISEPDFKKIYGYIGRTFAPTYINTDSYIQEPTAERQDYQLEPSIVIKDVSQKVTFYASYVDLLNKIKFYGGITNNHSRLFENEYYSFDPLIDYDKFVNFSQYYWLPNGPESVNVTTNGVELSKSYNIFRNNTINAYEFESASQVNPTIILARGGTYTFEVNQPGYKFWIQTEIGQLGLVRRTPTISSRTVLGVHNNGSDSGTITFTVPQRASQNRYIEMPLIYNVDLTTSLRYSDIQNNLISRVLDNTAGFDGMISQLDGKTLVFVNQDKISNQHSVSYIVDPNDYEEAWTVKGPIDIQDWDEVFWDTSPLSYWDRSQFTPGITVPESDRVSVWTIRLIPCSNILTFSGNITAIAGTRIVQEVSGASALVLESVTNSNSVKVQYENMQIFTTGTGSIRIDNVSQTVYPITSLDNDYIINLTNQNSESVVRTIQIDEKVYIKTGKTNANTEFYRDINGLKQVPLITSNLDTLYYQDGTSTHIYGEIQIVDVEQWSINIENDVLNRKFYTSPNGITFTNGLKVNFGLSVLPESYQNTEFYVEGVGTAITLTAVELLVIPEEYHTLLNQTYGEKIFPDYIMINRSSLDLNPWSRNNRWFHSDVIKATQRYNHPTQPVIYDQTLRAVRPIIEFESNISLYNNGKIGKKHITIIDTITLDAFNAIQGQSITNAYGIELTNGIRIIFANDQDLLVRNKIYVLNFIYPHTDVDGNPIGSPQINLTLADDAIVQEFDSVVITNGSHKGSSWWFNGLLWIQSQQKTKLQQSPNFDIFDNKGVSYTTYTNPVLLADVNATESTAFQGTKIFGYKISSAGVADAILGFPISYRNFSTQGEIEFQNYFDTEIIQFDTGTDMLTNVPINNTVLRQNIDRYNFKQRNVWTPVTELSKQYQSISYPYVDTNIFVLPVEPSSNETTIPYIKVYQNSKLLGTSKWTKTDLTISIIEPMVVGDIINIFIYSNEIIDESPYQIPLNLDFNAQNQNFTSLTLGQLRNHVDALVQNSKNVTGSSVGSNNLRDIQYKQQGGNILQHSAPVPYASLFLIDDTINFITATTLAQQEYTKFKNKFLELSVNLSGINPNDPATSVDLILTNINSFKNTSFPWYYSDMVPYGANKNILDVVVYDPLVRLYEITNVFNDNILSNTAILVYINSDPSAIYIKGTDIDVISDILNKSEYVSPSGVVFENNLKIRFGSDVTPAYYQNNSYLIQGVGSEITLITINNNVQLIKDHEYTFDQTRPAIIISDSVILDIDYRITIVEYSNTDGNYIPETPTKLGLYPKFAPKIVEDDSYRTTINVIVGHDGSKTPTFGDYRDDFLLELEKRIYNNIKINTANIIVGINDFIPGKFRDTGYTLSEFDSILTQNFLNWVGNNTLDYSSNLTFQSNDAFTWNYTLFSDSVNGEKLPGSWKAIYKYFFDTETPHQTPWEMLGFSEKPDWWENYYGPAPYTGTNALLWEQLEAGQIVEGDRAGIDSRFARPGLLSIIPVDSNGFLRSPVEFLTATFNSKNATTAWAIGNQGPVEAAWRRSSDFPYALQIAMALSKPARYFGNLIDTQNYNYDTNLNQYILSTSKQHIKQNEILVNGKNTNGLISRASGYINWIADQLTYYGINPYNTIDSFISNFQVNLTYKVAGFTDQSSIKVLAEQYSPTSTNDSILIPNENFDVHLNKSTPVQKIVYSAVIVEKTNNGYSVRGYNLSNPYFTIIPSIVNSHSSKITVLNEDATIYFDYQFLLITVPYGYEFQSQQQLVDFLISYERYLQSQGFIFVDLDDTLGEVRNWQLSSKEFLYWIQQGWPIGSILVLSPIADTINVISNGIIVDEITDSTTGSRVVDQNFTIIRNIDYTVLRSPTQFKMSLTNGQIIGLVSLNLVQYEHVLIFDNITVFNDVIYKPELGNRQFRLKLIGQLTNNWDGSLSPGGFIYNSGVINSWNPGHDYFKGDLVKFKSQYYVALNKTIASDNFKFADWKQINYSSIKTGLLPNFASIAKRAESYYDTYSESIDTNPNFQGGTTSNQSHYGYGLIGFKRRDYLDKLGLSDITQVELYKGFIKQKGTVNAVTALTNAQFNTVTGKIDFFEEWAVRVGEYGALDINPFIEVILDEKTFSTNAQVLEFVNLTDQNRSNGLNIISSNNLYKSSGHYTGLIATNRDQFSNYTNDMPDAGFVNINDVDTTIFNIANFSELKNKISTIGSGYTIWCAKDFKQQWNVYRVTESNNFVISISNALDGFISITCKEYHGLNEKDIILIKQFSTIFDGIYQIYKIVNLNTVLVQITELQPGLTTITGSGILFTLQSLRFDYMENVRLYTPPNGWKEGEKVWIDHVAPDGDWGTYERIKPWEFSYSIERNAAEQISNDGFGTSLKMNDSTTIIAVGSPYNTVFQTLPKLNCNGVVDIFIKSSAGTFIQDTSLSLTPTSPLTIDFGYSVDLTETLLAVGAPSSESNKGHVYLYLKDTVSARFNPLQVLLGESNDRFGSVVSFSRDGLWLYVGAPGNGKVYAYALNSVVTPQRIVSQIGPDLSADVLVYPLTPDNADEITVYGNGIFYIAGVDYILSIDKTYITITELPEYNVPIEILQYPTFRLIDTITGPGPAAEEFGYAISVSADGAQIGIGAPGANVVVDGTTLTNAGIVYVYDRTIEAFTSINQKEFTTTNTIKSIHRVTVNGLDVSTSSYTAVGNTLTFSSQIAGGIVVTIETNTFNILQILTGSDPQFDSRHGTTLVICSFNCAIYIGAPGFDVSTGKHDRPANAAIVPVVNEGVIVNSGAVIKNHNQGRLYGTIAGTKVNPEITPGHSLRLNDFEVIFTGFSQIIVNNTIIKQISLNGNITANIGDYITQTTTGANVTILSTSGSNVNLVSVSDYNNSNKFDFGNTAGNISINGSVVDNVKPIADLESVVIDINNKNIVGISAIVEVKISEEIYTKDSIGIWYDSTNTEVVNINTLQYLNSTTSNNIKLFENSYYRINRIWQDSDNNILSDVALINLLENNAVLRLNSQSTVARNKMRVLSGVGTCIADLGLDVFYQMQILTSPNNIRGEQFGTKLSLEKGAHKLVISSKHGSTIIMTSFDIGLLTFDDNSTQFKETINSSGSAYLFELYDDPRDSVELPGRYSFTQQFDPGDLNLGDQFGVSCDIIGDYVVVSAPNDSTTLTNGGSVYLFNNISSNQGWVQISKKTDKVDIDSISRQYLYNKTNGSILQSLQTIDPSKGKILGQAEQEITYKTNFDPAIYNKGFRSTVNISSVNWWDSKQVYQIWWNLDTIRYIDYEQGDLTYRSLNWGKLFPGSTVDIYEWTESIVLPSQYVANNGDGIPLYNDDSAYVEVITVDSVTNAILIKYYFWVKDKTSLTAINSYRKLTTSSIASMIENPINQGIPYTAIIKDNALSLYNISNYLNDSLIVLHVTSGLINNNNIIHSEYALIKNSPTGIIPQSIIEKLIDSLSGINILGQAVPDPTLNQAERYGIATRPRQTMFVDQLSALSQAVNFLNSVLIQTQLTDVSKITMLYAEDPVPKEGTGVWDFNVRTYDELHYLNISTYPIGYRVLVNSDLTQSGLWVVYVKTSADIWEAAQVQAYKTSQYWSTVDWYAPGFDKNTYVDFVVQTTTAALQLPYVHGNIIKIVNAGNSKWRLVQVIDTDIDNEGIDFHNEFQTVGLQDGTIQINVTNNNTNLGFNNQAFAQQRFDQTPGIETRYILAAMLQVATIESNIQFKSIINDLLFLLINYIYTEQVSNDWIFKTSFTTVLHRLRSLVQTPNYTNDNQTYYQDYINEVKPYKTKVREYVLNYTGDEKFNGSLTDFDLPSYFDFNSKTFRSPSGELPAIDEAIWQTFPFNEWYNNRTYEIGSIVVSNSGSGYTIPPLVTINSQTGSGATAHSIIDGNTGKVTDIIIDNHGSGYSSIVTVTINGNGFGATAYALFKQNQVRSIATTIKFDRIGYNSRVSKWSANTTYTSGDIVSFDGAAYTVNFSTTGNITTYTSSTNIDFTKLTVYNANAFAVSSDTISMGANDRIVGYYQPDDNMTAIETSTAYIVTSNATINSTTIYVNSVTDLHKGMHISESNANISMITEVVANVASGVNYINVDRLQTLSSNAVLTATYNNLSQLITGFDYPGVQVTGTLFEESAGFDVGASFGRSLFDQVEYDSDGIPILGSAIVDSIIRSNYTDDALGTRPEDIDIVGGNFVDMYSSHAPEELVPGMTFDTLDIKVFTNIDNSILAYRIFNNMLNKISYLRISNEYQTTLSANLNITDRYIYVADATKLPLPNKIKGIPGVIFVNSERITYYRNYAQEVTPWLPNVEFVTDSVLSYGNLITFNDTITTINAGDYIFQEVSGTTALVTADVINGISASLYYLDSSVFVLNSGNIQVINSNDVSNVANIAADLLSGNITSMANISTYPIISDIAYYKTTDNTLSTSFNYYTVSPLFNNDINVLSQIRRGTEGTGTSAIYITGQEVFDGSESQIITNTSTGTITLTSSSTYKSAENLGYILRLDGNITANVGDIITQSISGAEVLVSHSVSESSILFVTYNLPIGFTYGNLTAEYSVSINNVLVNAYPASMTLQGYNINSVGNVTIPTATTLITDKVWYKSGIGTATNGSGFGSGTIVEWTEQEKFLWDSPYQ